MSAVVYPALAFGDRTAGYHALFPDLPNCTPAGASMAELLVEAREAVQAALKTLEHERQDWPEPTDMEQLRERPEFAAGVLMLVDVQVDDTPVRVNISIGERLLKRIDQAAEAQSISRSGYIAASARSALGEKAAKAGAAADFEGAARRLQDELAAVGRRINESLGPHSMFSRNMAEWDERFYDTVRKTADSISAAVARRRQAEPAATEPAEPVRPETPSS